MDSALLSTNVIAIQAGLEPAALSLIAQVPTNVLVKASACRATLASVTQDSKESIAVKTQDVRVLETVPEMEFACRRNKVTLSRAGKCLSVRNEVY